MARDDSMSDDDRRGDDDEEGQRKSKRRSESDDEGGKDDESSDDESRGDRRRGDDEGRSGAKVTRTMKVEDDDAAFVLGRGGSTKRKIARVSGADIDLDEHSLTITITGTAEQCDHAMDYINFVRRQRVGPVTIDFEESMRTDLTAYPVPEDCIGFVMGRGGQTLRGYEEEWGVINLRPPSSPACS